MKEKHYKKMLCILFAVCLLLAAVPVNAAATKERTEEMGAETKKLDEITLRDPFVLVHDGKYYMYGTGAARGNGYGCYTSENLVDWSGPVNVFTAGDGFDGTQQFWAPECHLYKGSFYLFASYYSASTAHRGTSVFKSDSPLGPFTEISNGHATPHDKDSIDGTLYVDGDGQPWMVYVNEWTSAPGGIGRMDAAKMSDDLTHFISQPVELFRADDAPWGDSGVTDGPFLYTTTGGKLLMMWSSFSKLGYCVGIANSKDGAVDGKWTQSVAPLYRKNVCSEYDGGHSMLFTDLDGRLMMSAHSPNGGTEEYHTRPILREVTDTGSGIALKENIEALQSAFKSFNAFFAYLWDMIKFGAMLFKYAFS